VTGPTATDPPATRRVLVLGSTGSIGTQTLDVVAHLNRLHDDGRHPTRYQIVGLAAGRNAQVLSDQASELGLKNVALAQLSDGAPSGCIAGPNASETLVRDTDADVVVSAMVGSAGLPATLAAIEMGRDVALANKETLVAAGQLVIPAAQRSGSRILPLDSEHAGLWQCLQSVCHGCCPPMTTPGVVRTVTLTASGGPFRTSSPSEIRSATREQALAHPTWSMGQKNTIDSASLINKALEIIEAHWLFGLEPERIGVLVHPQSIVHALIETIDGSLLAQLGVPDMRLPIMNALTFPDVARDLGQRLDLGELSRLEFEPPDLERFPALGLAYDVMEAGGTSGAVFNAANETAVSAFLDERIAFGRISDLVGEALGSIAPAPVSSLGDVLEADRAARAFVGARL